MRPDRKGPLLAFGVIGVIAVLVLATSVRSRAERNWIGQHLPAAIVAVAPPVTASGLWGAVGSSLGQAVQHGVVLVQRATSDQTTTNVAPPPTLSHPPPSGPPSGPPPANPPTEQPGPNPHHQPQHHQPQHHQPQHHQPQHHQPGHQQPPTPPPTDPPTQAPGDSKHSGSHPQAETSGPGHSPHAYRGHGHHLGWVHDGHAVGHHAHAHGHQPHGHQPHGHGHAPGHGHGHAGAAPGHAGGPGRPMGWSRPRP